MSTTQETNQLLAIIPNVFEPVLVLLVGASGAGKTWLAKAVAARLNSLYARVAFFDSKGVPSSEERARLYGSASMNSGVDNRTYYAVRKEAPNS